jgi:hypothetical protein
MSGAMSQLCGTSTIRELGCEAHQKVFGESRKINWMIFRYVSKTISFYRQSFFAENLN